MVTKEAVLFGAGQREEGTLKLLFGTSAAPAAAARPVPTPRQLTAARVFIQRRGESGVPCSTKAASSSFPVSHLRLREDLQQFLGHQKDDLIAC